MSWVRWGSRCGQLSWPIEDAHDDCPGSDVYVYDDVTRGLTCCGCIMSADRSVSVKTEADMLAHLLEHDAAGHHVPRHLLREARATGKDGGDG